jgi:hypothetical protein
MTSTTKKGNSCKNDFSLHPKPYIIMEDLLFRKGAAPVVCSGVFGLWVRWRGVVGIAAPRGIGDLAQGEVEG